MTPGLSFLSQMFKQDVIKRFNNHDAFCYYLNKIIIIFESMIDESLVSKKNSEDFFLTLYSIKIVIMNKTYLY